MLRGGARIRGPRGVADLIEQLAWVDHLPLTDPDARQAALVDGELAGEGQEINLGNVLIAGPVREAGGTVFTSDTHFDRVNGLDVVNY